MTEVISIRFKTCGKTYFFSPGELTVSTGEKVIVETSKGIEMAECTYGNHLVEDTAVIQPLRSVIRIATAQDLKTAETNRAREKEAFEICRKKIAEHGLDMKLVSAECSFEGTKTLFFFTSDGRVDFRELVKDLAGIFHNRIELRQIGVRDEAKMVGGIGICGRPYCCGQFLDDFAPVSTKMAKVQSLSLNPTKISGSCGRLMCCLRYEEEAYEDLLGKVPKQGAFVQTPDGYGTVVQTTLLRQTVKVRIDGDAEDNLHQYSADEIAAVPGGRPADGTAYPDVLSQMPKKEESAVPEKQDFWTSPSFFAEAAKDAEKEDAADESADDVPADSEQDSPEKKSSRKHYRRRRGRNGGGKHLPAAASEAKNETKQTGKPSSEKKAVSAQEKKSGKKPDRKPKQKPDQKTEPKPAQKPDGNSEQKPEKKKKYYGNRHRYYGKKNGGSGKPKSENS